MTIRIFKLIKKKKILSSLHFDQLLLSNWPGKSC